MNHLTATTALAEDRPYAMPFASELGDAFVTDDISHELGDAIEGACIESPAECDSAPISFESPTYSTAPSLCEPSSNPIGVCAQSIGRATQRFHQSNAGRTCQMGGVKTPRSLARRQYS